MRGGPSSRGRSQSPLANPRGEGGRKTPRRSTGSEVLRVGVAAANHARAMVAAARARARRAGAANSGYFLSVTLTLKPAFNVEPAFLACLITVPVLPDFA